MAAGGLKKQQRKWIFLLLTPALLAILTFTTIPALTTLSYAFFRWEGFVRLDFAGLENFQRLME